MTRQKPFVSVIVPVYGRAEALAETVSALQEQTYPAGCYEIILVDNGACSPLDSFEIGQENLTLVKESVPGSYSARNAGIRQANGEILAFTDSDCLPERSWIENGVSTLRGSDDIGLVAGRVRVTFSLPDRPTAVELYDSLVSFPQDVTIQRYHYGATANLFTTRNVIRKVGLFNPNQYSGGDCEWGRRVYGAGYRQLYCDSAIVQHPARKTLKEISRKSRRVTIGTAYSLASDDGSILRPRSWYHHLVKRPVRLWISMARNHARRPIGTKINVIAIYYMIKLIQILERARTGILNGKPRR